MDLPCNLGDDDRHTGREQSDNVTELPGIQTLCSSMPPAEPIVEAVTGCCRPTLRPAPTPVRVADRPPDPRPGIQRTPDGRPALPGWDCAHAGSRVPRCAPQWSPETGSDRSPRCSPDHPGVRPWQRLPGCGAACRCRPPGAVRSTVPGCAPG